MPRLIDPTAQERPIARPIGGVRSQPSPANDAIARGAQNAGNAIEQGTDDVYRVEKAAALKLEQEQKVEEERLNTLRADEAFSKLRDRQLDLSLGDKNGFAMVRGANAVSRPLLQEWGKRFQDAQTEIAGTLTNDRQRQKFTERALVSRGQFNEDILRHLAREGDTYAKEVYDGTVVTEVRSATANWDSPNGVGLSLERIKHAVEERAERYNWPAEYRNAQLQIEQGKVHASVVQQAIASGNYKYAEAWYAQHREDIDPSTAKALETAVRSGTQKELTAGYNSEYLANENSNKALDSLRKRVLEDPTLEEDRRNILVGRIQTRQSVLEHRSELLEAKRVRAIDRSLADLNASTLAGFEPTQAQFAPLLAASKGTEAEGDVRQAIKLADATRSFRNATPQQQEQYLSAAENGIRTEPTKYDRKVVTAWRQIYDNQRRQVKESPVSFAVQQGLVEPPQPLDLSNPTNTAQALADRFAIARGVATRYQAPFKPLTPEEVGLLKATLSGSTVEQKRKYFAGLAQASGNDLDGYKGIMAQLAPDDPVTAIAGIYAARGAGGGQVSDLILRGQSVLNPNKKEDGHPQGGKLWAMPAGEDEKTMRGQFNDYERDAFAGYPQARSDHYQAAVAIYAARSVEKGDASGKLDSDRWKEAMKLATGGIERWNGKSIVMPWGYERGQFKDELRRRVEVLGMSGRLPEGVTPGKLMDLPLEVAGDGRYVFRAGDGVLVEGAPKAHPLATGLLAAPQDESKWGQRQDGTKKGRGFLGVLQRPDGGVSSELTVGVTVNGKEMDVPSLVPTLTRAEVESVLKLKDNERMPESVVRKAQAFAEQRMKAGKGVFADPSETPVPYASSAQRPIIIDFNQSMPYVPSGSRR